MSFESLVVLGVTGLYSQGCIFVACVFERAQIHLAVSLFSLIDEHSSHRTHETIDSRSYARPIQTTCVKSRRMSSGCEWLASPRRSLDLSLRSRNTLASSFRGQLSVVVVT